MFGSPDSPAFSSLLSLLVSAVAALIAVFYFTNVVDGASPVALIVAASLAFMAVALGVYSLSEPQPGLWLALLGMGLGMGVIVLAFLVFIYKLAHP